MQLGTNSGNGLGGVSKHKQDIGLVAVVGSSTLCSLFFVGGSRMGVLCQTLNLHYRVELEEVSNIPREGGCIDAILDRFLVLDGGIALLSARGGCKDEHVNM